jgi:hypothetical protein
MKVINLFGEPSVGKSTTAAGLFFLMKQQHYNVELITEYAKQCVWEERKLTLEDQLYITAKQNHQLERLRGKVTHVITDSPLLLGILYSRASNRYPSFHTLIQEVYDSYDNVNVFLKRTKPYQPIGRIQTEEQAKEVRAMLEGILDSMAVPYVEMDGNLEAPQKILDLIRQEK